MTTSEFEPPPAAIEIGPVTESARIDAIDAVRGFALLGIFLVNIHSFGEPFGKFAQPHPSPGKSVSETIAFYAVKVLCEGKFYPLFSMLFGMGLVLQYQRAIEGGRRFIGIGLRRLFVLMFFGAVHALLLWYGDILFIYAISGMVLLLFLFCQARTLYLFCATILFLALLASAVLTIFVFPTPESRPEAAPTPAVVEHFSDPFGRLSEAFERKELEKDGPAAPIWMQTETQAYREGPYDQLFKFRALSWILILIICAVGFGWEIAAMMFFGAALLKSGLFTADHRHWLRRFFLIGLILGLPMSAFGALAPRYLPGALGSLFAVVMQMIGGPLLSLGYLGGIALVVDRGSAPGLTRALANAGRMALTNYLTQTVLATTIFYYYGLALFAQTTRVERIGIVLGIYCLQLILSSIWLRYFLFGPMEWLWRTLTYLRPQPLLRR
jgi:uncharacterized protein